MQKRGRKLPVAARSVKGESGTFFCWLRGSFSIAGEHILFQVEDTESPIEVEVTGRFKKWLAQQGGNLPMEPVWVSGWPSVQMGKLIALKPKFCFKTTLQTLKKRGTSGAILKARS